MAPSYPQVMRAALEALFDRNESLDQHEGNICEGDTQLRRG